MIWGMFAVLLLGMALGAASLHAWYDAMRVLQKDWAKKEQTEMHEEIKRLRAQVAGLIGVEKSTPPTIAR